MSLRQDQWMEVGMTFEKTPDGGPPGLCYQLRHVIGSRRHAGIIGNLLSGDERLFPGSDYWLNFTVENNLLRASFAYLMAAMTDEERDAIVEGL